MSASLLLNSCLIQLSSPDSFYVFDQSISQSSIPKRISESEASKVDLLQGIVHPRASTDTPVVELSSEKSGIKLSFSSNRESPYRSWVRHVKIY